ncbi:MAG: ATP-binding protein [Propionibacteriaceae bacterium]|nr:ATP-binding protein [Propionibacteriaceae bacterium]
MGIVERPEQLAAIEPFVGAPMVKVLTGMRRAGKSTVLRMVASRLKESLGADRVIELDFDALAFSPLTDGARLKTHLDEAMAEPGGYAVFLDEVQEVDGWEKVVNSLLAEGRCDIYVTGSNSKLLSSELATYIAGRYVAHEVRTLSFAEHLDFAKHLGATADVNAEFERFLRWGGFPGTRVAPLGDDDVYRAVRDIYNSALLRDVLHRKAIRNPDMLERLAAFALDTTGSVVSAASIARYLRSQNRKIDPDTALGYVSALSEAYIVNKCHRYDIQGKQRLAVHEKYYPGDHGLLSAVLGPSALRLPGTLEAVVWAELRRRGWTLGVGKWGDAEVDFVAEKDGARVYYQVTTAFANNAETLRRELRPLQAIPDSYPKRVLSMEPVALPLEGGIEHFRIPDFLLDKSL